MRVGRRLAIKLLNSGRFILGLPTDGPGAGGPAGALDLAMLAGLDEVVAGATADLEAADWASALERAERFFWTFCDHYLELVKDRAYRPAAEEAGIGGSGPARRPRRPRGCSPPTSRTPRGVWSWWRDGSVHLSPWPVPDAALAGADRRPLEAASRSSRPSTAAKSQPSYRCARPSPGRGGGPPRGWTRSGRPMADLAAAGRVAAFRYRERPDETARLRA